MVHRAAPHDLVVPLIDSLAGVSAPAQGWARKREPGVSSSSLRVCMMQPWAPGVPPLTWAGGGGRQGGGRGMESVGEKDLRSSRGERRSAVAGARRARHARREQLAPPPHTHTQAPDVHQTRAHEHAYTRSG